MCAKPRRPDRLVGSLATWPHVKVGAEHRLAENRQLRRAHRQADGETSDDGDFRPHANPESYDAIARPRISLRHGFPPRSSPEIRPRRKTRTRSAFMISSGTSEEIKTIATPSLAMPRRIP